MAHVEFVRLRSLTFNLNSVIDEYLTIYLPRRTILSTCNNSNRECDMPEISRLQQYLKELAKLTTDPIHKRLISAFMGDNPKESMEAELGKILSEVVKHED